MKMIIRSQRQVAALTAILRKSEKSVVRLLQQDQPWEAMHTVSMAQLHYPLISKLIFLHVHTFKASWNTGTPGWYVHTSMDKKRVIMKCDVKGIQSHVCKCHVHTMCS